jgi:flagella basal body P-ring formation protein FlgA
MPSVNHNILTLLISLSLLHVIGSTMGFSTGSCLASEVLRELRVRQEVWIESDRVKLLDLFHAESVPEDWKNLMAGIDLGEAPTVGNDKFIASGPLRSYLDQLLSSRGIDGSQVKIVLPPEQVTIKRQASQIAGGEIEEIFRSHILSNAPWRPEDMEIQGITYSGLTDLPAGKVSHVVESNPKERYVGNVVLTIHFYVDGRKKRSVRVAGKVQLYQEVVVAVRPLSRNDTVGENDIQLQRFQVGENPDRYALSPAQVIGRRLLRDTGLYQPLLLNELDAPLAIKKGAAVTILYEQPGLRISTRGQAREDGRMGKTIRVLNLQTNRTVLSEIVDEATVRAIP